MNDFAITGMNVNDNWHSLFVRSKSRHWSVLPLLQTNGNIEIEIKLRC